MKLNEAMSVEYRRDTKAVIVSFADGSQASWPVRLLEMTKRTDDGYVPISPSDDELSAVELFGGDSIIWDELGQIFRIKDLQNHIYGRKAWMESLLVSTVSGKTTFYDVKATATEGSYTGKYLKEVLTQHPPKKG